jgi:RNA polymerase-binding transcription factor DksA
MLVKELRAERNRLVAQLEDGQNLETAALQDMVEPRDWADASTAQRDAGRFAALTQLAARRLHAIQHALDRAAQGRFSICERCDAGIPVERLRVLPETTVCTDCARELEVEARRRA